MKLSQKRTCNGCKTEISSLSFATSNTYSCDLGVKVSPKKAYAGLVVIEWRPDSPCYKPKTNSELVEAYNLTKI